ncbi:nonstructural protein [Sandfly fever Naples virus]|uniref:Nonstructural protein n=3 Tax=Phlebovirus TaxID=11584 RepID=A0ABM5MCP1_9VIRU|nr:nonstructural protein [Leticia virus]ABQ23559.1 nonstructural protein [Phlebovirus sp. Co Ar 171616]AEL29651.1 nonstructural protein [Leticia virus]AEL29663.1 nonstructural protein [Sandfly fever Naples virus]
MYKTNHFAREIPIISHSVGPLHRVSVDYIPFGKKYDCPVSLYKGAEIPVHSLSQSAVERNKLLYFLDEGLLPKSWGFTNSFVLMKSPEFFDTTIERLSDLRIESCLKWCEPNIKKALSWPLGYPSFKFFQLSMLKSYEHNWLAKCDFATQVMRIGQGLGLDDSLRNLYKFMLNELSDREISSLIFTGQNIEKEIAYIQIIRMMTALPFDLKDDCCQSPLFNIIQLQSEVTSQHILGNAKWAPITMLNQ